MFNYLVSDHVLSLSRGVLQRFERGIDMINYLIADRVLFTARAGYKYAEVEGISQLEIRGLSTLFDTVSQRVVSISQWAYPHIELKGFEAFNEAFTKNVARLSEKVRDTHTGVLSYNMLGVLVGIILLMVLLFIYGGSLEVFV